MNCFITARGKSKIETTGVSVKWIPIFFDKEFVHFFLVDLRVYTSDNIFLPLARAQQTLLILCSVGVSVVLHLRSYAI